MKRKVTIGSLIVLLLVSFALNIYLLKDSIETKRELGANWKLIAQNSNDLIDFMRRIDLNEATKNVEGREILEDIQHRILWQLRNNFPETHDVLDEVEKIIIKAIEEGYVTEEDVKTYINSLGVIDTIIYNFNEDFKTRMDWYKAFSNKNKPNTFTKALEEVEK